MHIEQFPKETQDFIYALCSKAIARAIKNGTFKEREQDSLNDNIEEASSP